MSPLHSHKPSTPRPSRRRWIGVLLVTLLMAGCSSLNVEDDTQGATGSPTTTMTPAREIIIIDEKPVIQIFIPDEAQGPTYALTASRLYRSVGGGWEPTRTRNDSRVLLVDPADPERIFRGNHPPCFGEGVTPDIPLEVSHDGGLSWRVQPQGRNIRPMAIDASIPTILYGSSCYLAISTTSGNTWMRLALMEDFPLVDFVITGEQLLILGSSRDGVSRLRTIDITDPAKPLEGELLLEIPGPATLDALGERIVVGGVQAVHVSDDGGATWSSSRFGLEAVTSSVAPAPARGTDINTESLGVHAIRIGITDKQRLYAGTSHGLYISQDGGATWVRYDEVSLDAVITGIQFTLSGADIFVTTDKGVLSVPNP